MKYNWKKIHINEIEIDQTVINQVSLPFIQKFNLVPITINLEGLIVVHYDAKRFFITNPYRLVYNQTLLFYLISQEDYEFLMIKIKQGYETQRYQQFLPNQTIDMMLEEPHSEFYDVKLATTMVVRTINSIIEKGIVLQASDIHYEPTEKKVLVRMRKDGILQTEGELDLNIYQQMISRIKVLGNMDISKHFISQDGKISYEYEQNKYDIRVSILPTIYGERISLRILDYHTKQYELDDLYLNEVARKDLVNLVTMMNGIILVTGPTGSGKTTTLYSLLKKRISEKINIITVEDPIEYTIPGTSQVQVDENIGRGFPETLRSVLRQDPDILMIGEIRDEKTAEIAIRSAITGHLVFSTLHTNDTEGTIIRLSDMKIPSYLLASSIKGIISQRLVRKLCPYCKKQVISDYKQQSSKRYEGVGCKKCNYTGFLGRLALAEVLVIDEKIQKAIRENNLNKELHRYYQTKKVKKLQDLAIEAMEEGLTTLEEIKKIINY